MNTVKLLIFDLDGTLIDSKQDIANSVNLTFRDIGLPEKPHETIYGYVGNGVRQLILDAIASDDAQEVDHALQIFEAHYLSHLLDETRLFPGIEAVLHHYGGKKKALVTNKPEHYTTKIVQGLQVDKHFDVVLAASPAVRLKPHPEMILMTLETLGIRPEDAVMIGDSLNDIHAARSAGIRACGVGYGFGDAKTLKAEGLDYYAESGEALLSLFS